MGESEKPFACPSPGCNMSFTNEDHLVVHKKKHDMILNLGSGKTGVFVADQTPTPTRFIRNCEEVGLFQDLQNVNPFEETFRRAVESGKIGSLPESEIDRNDDTLHTPHVFPHIEDRQSSGNRKISSELSEDLSKINNSENMKITDEKPEIITCEVTKNVMSTTTIRKTSETIVIQEADTSVTPVVASASTRLSINGEEVQLLLKTDDGKLMQLSAIPVCDPLSAPSITAELLKPQTFVIKTDLPVECPNAVQLENESSRLSLAKMRLREVLAKNETHQETRKIDLNKNYVKKNETSLLNGNEEEALDTRKKQEILARNRASSMRARAKRKMWIQQLQKSVSNVNEVNTILQLEIKSLRSEVAKLKTLLLAHEDCPVTKAVEKGSNIFAESKIIPMASQSVQLSPTTNNDSCAPGNKRKISNDIPTTITTKKKSSVLPQKRSILLPKIDEKNLPICVTKIIRNPCQQIKFIDLSEISENRTKKPIIIVQNPGLRKVQSINSRQILQIDQSLKLINVASKSIGT